MSRPLETKHYTFPFVQRVGLEVFFVIILQLLSYLSSSPGLTQLVPPAAKGTPFDSSKALLQKLAPGHVLSAQSSYRYILCRALCFQALYAQSICLPFLFPSRASLPELPCPHSKQCTKPCLYSSLLRCTHSHSNKSILKPFV